MTRWSTGEAEIEKLLDEGRALRAQFGAGFRAFGAMRRRRHELEYPSGPGETATLTEALAAVADAHVLLDAAAS